MNQHPDIIGTWPSEKRREGVKGNPRNYQAAIDELDAISRTRALTEAESIMLERMIWRVEKKGTRRSDYGSNKVLARAGIKRGGV